MIVTACDENYLFEARNLIASCRRHEPNQRFYLYLVNSQNVSDATIARWHPKILIERVQIKYDSQKWRGLMCTIRSIPIVKALENYREKVIYLDSDIIIRAPLTKLWNALEYVDLMVKYRPWGNHLGAAGTNYASKFNSGVIAINSSDNGIRFAKEYSQNLSNFIASGQPLERRLPEEKIVSIVDQELLYVTYLNLKEYIHFQPLPEGYNDAKFLLRSVIWHGKGTARNHPLFRLEKVRCQNQFFYLFLFPVSQLLSLLRSFRSKIRNIVQRWQS
jgi:hypothetical protein